MLRRGILRSRAQNSCSGWLAPNPRALCAVLSHVPRPKGVGRGVPRGSSLSSTRLRKPEIRKLQFFAPQPGFGAQLPLRQRRASSAARKVALAKVAGSEAAQCFYSEKKKCHPCRPLTLLSTRSGTRSGRPQCGGPKPPKQWVKGRASRPGRALPGPPRARRCSLFLRAGVSSVVLTCLFNTSGKKSQKTRTSRASKTNP